MMNGPTPKKGLLQRILARTAVGVGRTINETDAQ